MNSDTEEETKEETIDEANEETIAETKEETVEETVEKPEEATIQEPKEETESNEVTVSELKPKMSNVNISFKVVAVGEVREIESRDSMEMHRVADAVVGDATGHVTLPLWNQSIDQFEAGNSYRLENAFTGLFRGHLRLKMSNDSKVSEAEDIGEVNEDLDMSAEDLHPPRPDHYYQPSRGYGGRSGYSRGNSRYRRDRSNRRRRS
jgi:ssDNA-binding replication factor A large subunit